MKIRLLCLLILNGVSWSKDLATEDTNHYHSYEEARAVFREYETRHPGLAKLHSIGQSVQGRELLVLQITRGAGGRGREHGKPMFKWVANMHGNEVELETKVIRMFPKISQSRRRPLLGPSPG